MHVDELKSIDNLTAQEILEKIQELAQENARTKYAPAFFFLTKSIVAASNYKKRSAVIAELEYRGRVKSEYICPLCNSQLYQLTDCMEHTLLEDHRQCVTCKKYFFSYVTGVTQEIIDGQEFVYGYSDDESIILAITKQITNVILNARIKYNGNRE